MIQNEHFTTVPGKREREGNETIGRETSEENEERLGRELRVRREKNVWGEREKSEGGA